MPNTLIAAIYIPFALLTAIVLLEVLFRKIAHKGKYMFVYLCLLIIGWYSCNIAMVLTNSVNTAMFLWNANLIFVGFIPPVLLLFVLDFYRVSLPRAAKYLPLVFVIPSINTIMALTSRYHLLMYTQLELLSLSPSQEIVRIWGPWFWVHTVHSYVMSIAIISTILIRHYRLPKFYRMPSSLMSLGISVTLLGNVITLLKLLPAAFDPTLIGTSVALLFFYFAIINNDRSKFVRYSFGKVIDYLDIYVLVMDESGRMVHVNRPALEWFSSLGIAVHSIGLNEIMEALASKGAILKDVEDHKGIDIYFPSDPFPVVLNMYVQKMVDANGDVIGSVVIFTDVTQNRLLLDRLEEKAGMDSLTGIANHMAYAGAKKRLDAPEYLPLTVIMCDVNGLKAVNDSLGHKYGDMMLQLVAEALETVCLKSQFVARIGGDEFVFLLPNTPQEAAVAFMEKIMASLASRGDLPFTLSVALGAATKYSVDEQIADIVSLADSRMYENKKMIKAQQQF